VLSEQKILEKLIVLQKFDQKIYDLEQKYQNIPKSIESIKVKIEKFSKGVEQLEKSILEKEAHLNNIKLDYQSSQEKIEQYEKQLMNVNTNKEYDAFLSEIEMGHSRLAQLEKEEQDMKIEIEAEKEDLEKAQGQKEKYIEEYDPVLQELEQKYQIVENEYVEKQEDRKTNITEIPKHVYKRYEKIRKATKGQAVVSILRNSACGGCFQTLPKQKVNEIMRNKHLISCEYCGRILYWDESQN